MGWVIVAGIVILVLFVAMIRYESKKSIEASQKLSDKLAEIDFTISKQADVLYVDDIKKQWFIQRGNFNGILPKICNYSDLIEFEVLEDGGSIAKGTTKGKVSGKTGSAIVGGLLFGPVGAVIGASGKRKTSSKTTTVTKNTCTSLSVNITVNDLQSPRIGISLITSEVGKETAIYYNAISSAKNIAATLAYIQSGKKEEELMKAQLEDEKSNNSKGSVEDLEKLYDLKEKGIITEEEFEVKKKQILGL